jgi:hypothetical protein
MEDKKERLYLNSHGIDKDCGGPIKYDTNNKGDMKVEGDAKEERLYVDSHGRGRDCGGSMGTSMPAVKLEVSGPEWGSCINPTHKLTVNPNADFGINKPSLEFNTVFQVNGNEEILKLCVNGDIFVKGKLIDNDYEVVDALKEFLTGQGFTFNKNKNNYCPDCGDYGKILDEVTYQYRICPCHY